MQGDVSKPEDVAKLFDATKEAFGRVDVAVNSAGVMLLSPIAQAKLDEFDRTIAINLHGAFLMMAKAAEALSNGGRFIAVSSSVIAKNFPGYGAYIASKAGVEGEGVRPYTMVLVEEVADGGWGRVDETLTLAKMGLPPKGK